MKKIIISKGKVALFLICAVIAVLAGWLANLCGLDKMSVVAVAYFTSTVSVLLMGAFVKFAQREGGPEAGIIGVLVGSLITLFF